MKPGLIDANDTITDDATRQFLDRYLDQFETWVAKFVQPHADTQPGQA